MNIKRPSSRQPIPKNAKKVFNGIMFDVYQWQQKLFNGKKKTFEKAKRIDTVNVIPVTPDGKIILSYQQQPGSDPFIGCVGGAIENDENPLLAAKRELLEETGFQAKEFILWDAVQFVDKIDWVIYTFIAKDCTQVAKQKLDSGERIKLIQICFDRYLDVIAQENYRDIEIALKLFRLQRNPRKFKQTRKLFSTV